MKFQDDYQNQTLYIRLRMICNTATGIYLEVVQYSLVTSVQDIFRSYTSVQDIFRRVRLKDNHET